LWNTAEQRTIGMRSKEQAHDYRYFPEPDLAPLIVSEKWREEIRGTIPELPEARRARFIADYGMSEYNAGVLTSSKQIADYFEAAVAESGDARAAANWVMGDLLGQLNAAGKEITESPVTAAALGGLLKLQTAGTISGKIAKDVFLKMFSTGRGAREIVESEGLAQISDTSALEKIVADVIAASPKQVEQYKGGKTTVLGYLVGQVMKATRGQANPAAVNELLKKALE
jgi:aspartyl-tRNA(Asn)/glutamyl-tRNA(Gln) amidotransferase subunit B